MAYKDKPEPTPPELQSYYLPAGHKYGYLININNPQMKQLYYRWKEKHGIPKRIPLSDQDRHQFDRDIMLLLQGRDNPKLTE